MGKIKLKAKLISNDDNLNIDIQGIKIDNKIIYKENDIHVTLLIENNKITMKRATPEYIIELYFDKNESTLSKYYFIGGNKIFNLNTNTKEININNNIIEIKYVLEDNEFLYTLEMEDL